MVKAFEKEEQDAAAKAEAELHKAQLAQAEAKRLEKIEQQRKEQEDERLAEEKARQEAAELAEVQKEELAREAALRDGKGPGDISPFKLNPDSLSVSQNRGQQPGQPGHRPSHSPISSPRSEINRSARSYVSNNIPRTRESDRGGTTARRSQNERDARMAGMKKHIPPSRLAYRGSKQPQPENVRRTKSPPFPRECDGEWPGC